VCLGKFVISRSPVQVGSPAPNSTNNPAFPLDVAHDDRELTANLTATAFNYPT
jgi:hypothetical protein